MKRFALLLLSLVCAVPTWSARADTSGAAGKLFAAGSVSERSVAIEELKAAGASDSTAVYALGSIEFFLALEKLAQGLHRHGFESPQSFMMPLMRLPVPPNPNPEPLTYEKFRAILSEFHLGMAAASATLAKVPPDAAIGIDVDLAKLGIDMDSDGKIIAVETAVAIVAGFSTAGFSDQPPPTPSLVFRFDRADGYWLQGYANFLMAQADFWLAHDFRNAFDGSFHMLFPAANLPLQDLLVPKFPGMDLVSSEWRIADLISLIHYINWQVVEPDRRRSARTELLEMIRLSRENWKAIRAETDNDREWLPGPQQKGVNPLTGLEVVETDVKAWHEALNMAEGLLEGRTLLPHFRITGKGMDMKRFFDEPQAFDLVPIITGPGAVPYLAEGNILTADEFWRIQGQFGRGGFMSFALWFN